MFLVVSYSNFTERFYNRIYSKITKKEAVRCIQKENEEVINIIDL